MTLFGTGNGHIKLSASSLLDSVYSEGFLPHQQFRPLAIVITMSKRQDNPSSYDPAMPWLTRPGGIQLSDWPADIVTPEMIAREAKWAKAGEQYDFQEPIRSDQYNRYVKETKNGPVYQNPPQIHRASDHYMLPPKRARANAADKPPGLQDFQRVNGDKSTRGLPGPTRDKEKTLKQAAARLKKKDLEHTPGERSSTRLQQKAQAALDLAQRKAAQESARHPIPTPLAPLLVEESAIRSTLQDPQTNPGLALATSPNPAAELESVDSANVASADIETKEAKSVVSGKSEPVNTSKPTATETASTTKSTVVPKAATSTKTKSTSAGKTTATTKTEAATKSTINKKAVTGPKSESCPRAVEAIPKVSDSTKVPGSSATSSTSKTTSQGVSSKKRKAVDTTTAATVKRPRIARACDACRDKKTRCDGNRACEACIKRKSNCVYGDGQPQPPKSAQDRDNGTPSDDGGSGKTHQDKMQPSGSKGNMTTSGASTTSNSVKDSKRKREDKGTDATAQSHPSKKDNPILHSPAAQAAKLRARQQLEGDIQRFIQGHSPISDASSRKRKRVPSDEESETRPAKLQRPTHYILEVLEKAKLDTMQKDIIDFLAQCSSDFKPLQKIGHLVRGGKLRPQIIDINLQEEAFHNRPSIKLVLPDHIKGFLVDDWENVTKNNQLVHLPHPKPVEVILQDYLAAEKPNREEGSTQMDILEETVAGLREYFDRALGRILLYRLVTL